VAPQEAAGRRHAPPRFIIVHVSDLHFGEKHRFDPPPGDDGRRGPREGFPHLHGSILNDLETLLEKSGEEGLADPDAFTSPADAPVRVLFALTGDFTETGVENAGGHQHLYLSVPLRLRLRPGPQPHLHRPGVHEVALSRPS